MAIGEETEGQSPLLVVGLEVERSTTVPNLLLFLDNKLRIVRKNLGFLDHTIQRGVYFLASVQYGASLNVTRLYTISGFLRRAIPYLAGAFKGHMSGLYSWAYPSYISTFVVAKLVLRILIHGTSLDIPAPGTGVGSIY